MALLIFHIGAEKNGDPCQVCINARALASEQEAGNIETTFDPGPKSLSEFIEAADVSRSAKALRRRADDTRSLSSRHSIFVMKEWLQKDDARVPDVSLLLRCCWV
ncbi:hypothetical protein HN011_003799 [Eciton burchellii]|nr:hypothetical protein HN011_003799 [Eciton burchellii]